MIQQGNYTNESSIKIKSSTSCMGCLRMTSGNKRYIGKQCAT